MKLTGVELQRMHTLLDTIVGHHYSGTYTEDGKIYWSTIEAIEPTASRSCLLYTSFPFLLLLPVFLFIVLKFSFSNVLSNSVERKNFKNKRENVWKWGFNCLIFAPAFQREGSNERSLNEMLKREVWKVFKKKFEKNLIKFGE